MKKGILYFSIAVMLASSMYMAYFYAMEAGRVSAGKEEMEEVPVKGKGKRLAEEQAEDESETKKEKIESSTSSRTSFIVKDIVKPLRVLNEQTGAYDIKDVVVDRLAINNEDEPELFTGTTFEELIKERTDEGLYYIIARVKTLLNGVEKPDYYDAFQYMTYLFGTDFTIATKNRYTARQSEFKVHPVNKQPILGPIEFYYIKHVDDHAFIYLGTDWDLHASEDTETATFIKRFFRANTPNELIGPDIDAQTQRAGNQFLIGQYYFDKNDLDEALHYFELARSLPAHAEAEPIHVENDADDYVNFSVDTGWYIAQIYYHQKKYDAAIAELKELEGHEWMSYNDVLVNELLGKIYFIKHDYEKALPYLENAQYRIEGKRNEQRRKVATKIFDPEYQKRVAELLGKTYYHVGNKHKALEYLKLAPTLDAEDKSLLSKLEENN